jgi:hypothetical protein
MSKNTRESDCSALEVALNDGQEVKIFTGGGIGPGYTVEIYGDCYCESRSKPTLKEAITEAAEIYMKWSKKTT